MASPSASRARRILAGLEVLRWWQVLALVVVLLFLLGAALLALLYPITPKLQIGEPMV
jgi:hypothetical protein